MNDLATGHLGNVGRTISMNKDIVYRDGVHGNVPLSRGDQGYIEKETSAHYLASFSVDMGGRVGTIFPRIRVFKPDADLVSPNGVVVRYNKSVENIHGDGSQE